jgi:hypothetical protein
LLNIFESSNDEPVIRPGRIASWIMHEAGRIAERWHQLNAGLAPAMAASNVMGPLPDVEQ